MKLLETSYLVDYEQGRNPAKRYYERYGHESFCASTVSMFELAFGVAWSSKRGLDDLVNSLRWVDFLSFSVADALEGAQIHAELQARGARIPITDMMIAGAARNRGATLVAADDHFEDIDGLSVENHRSGD